MSSDLAVFRWNTNYRFVYVLSGQIKIDTQNKHKQKTHEISGLFKKIVEQ